MECESNAHRDQSAAVMLGIARAALRTDLHFRIIVQTMTIAAPSISVIIPCHNAASWILDSVKSAMAQVSRPCEIIVVDDGSTDSSIESLIDAHLQCRVIATKGGNGGAGARNIGAREASGDWLAFLDADDRWYPNHLCRVKKSIQVGDDMFANCFDRLIDEDIFPATIPIGNTTETRHNLNQLDFIRLFETSWWFPGMSSIAMSRLIFNSVNGFDETFVRRHDIELWLRILQEIPQSTWTFDSLASTVYRSDTPDSLSRNIASRERFLHLAFQRNAPSPKNPNWIKVLQRTSKRAISAAVTDGSLDDIKLVRKMHWEGILVPTFVPRVAMQFPKSFRWLNRFRRWIGQFFDPHPKN